MADNNLKRIKILNSHAANARFLAEVDDTILGYVPSTVHEPYRFSSTKHVCSWRGQPVIVCETKHRRYEVFAVTGPLMSEGDAHAAFLVQQENRS